MTGGTSSS